MEQQAGAAPSGGVLPSVPMLARAVVTIWAPDLLTRTTSAPLTGHKEAWEVMGPTAGLRPRSVPFKMMRMVICPTNWEISLRMRTLDVSCATQVDYWN